MYWRQISILKMTEANMKRLYDHYVASGQTARAEEILKIPRYKEFDPKVKAARIKAEEEAKKKAEEAKKKAEEEAKSKKGN